jgi:epoxyqueuosine reductase
MVGGTLNRLSSAAIGGGGQRHQWLQRIPPLPRGFDRRRAQIPVWLPYDPDRTPQELRSIAGVRIDPDRAEEAQRTRPLIDFFGVHAEATRYYGKAGWNFSTPLLPRMLRGLAALRRINGPAGRPRRGRVHDPAELTMMIRAEADRIGLSTIGFTRFQPQNTFTPHPADSLPNMIVCIVEQDFVSTQTAPSGRAERSAVRAYTELLDRIVPLAEYVADMGYRVAVQDFLGRALVIPYAVEAGLGQLGLNGQLLTPQAGSRCRIALIGTNAPVELGVPVDYGIEKLCDSCQLCVRRCPVGAIPAARSEHRGVVKAKIKAERCFPTMAQTHGCSVCMKVCPVQRYGLEAIHDHFRQTGEILGKGTDTLEGYQWPPDGRYYGLGRKPRIDVSFVNPKGWSFDKERTGATPDGGS